MGWGFCSRDIWASEATQVLGAVQLYLSWAGFSCLMVCSCGDFAVTAKCCFSLVVLWLHSLYIPMTQSIWFKLSLSVLFWITIAAKQSVHFVSCNLNGAICRSGSLLDLFADTEFIPQPDQLCFEQSYALKNFGGCCLCIFFNQYYLYLILWYKWGGTLLQVKHFSAFFSALLSPSLCWQYRATQCGRAEVAWQE